MMSIYLVHKARVGVNILSFILYIPCKYKKLNVGEKKFNISMVHLKMKKKNNYLPTIKIANIP
jgi:hypothetical protein